jgi:leader peptidase (prepilin peptidase)/N-methyltransferase
VAPILLVLLVVGALAIGPWASIVVDRAVEREPLRAEHRCTQCGAGLGSSSLYPVLHWSLRCPHCERNKGLRYVMVDVALVAVFVALGIRFGWSVMLAPYLLLGTVLVVLSAIDIETHLLPNIIVWPSIFAGLFVILVMSGELDYGPGINSALLGSAVFGGFIGAAHVIYEQGMGRGDVKLSVLLGLFVGWIQPSLIDTTRLVLFTILLALIGGGVVGLIYNTVRDKGRAEIPFGPALAAASLVVVLLSPTLVGDLGP